MNNIFTPLAVTIIPVGPDGESPPRARVEAMPTREGGEARMVAS